jgi:hypothetical protein
MKNLQTSEIVLAIGAGLVGASAVALVLFMQSLKPPAPIPKQEVDIFTQIQVVKIGNEIQVMNNSEHNISQIIAVTNSVYPDIFEFSSSKGIPNSEEVRNRESVLAWREGEKLKETYCGKGRLCLFQAKFKTLGEQVATNIDIAEISMRRNDFKPQALYSDKSPLGSCEYLQIQCPDKIQNLTLARQALSEIFRLL